MINLLILPSDGLRVIPYVGLIFADVSIPRSRLQWSQADRLGKHRTSSSVGRLHASEKATTIARSRSNILAAVRCPRASAFSTEKAVTYWLKPYRLRRINKKSAPRPPGFPAQVRPQNSVDYSADAQEPVKILNPVSPENGFS